MENSEEKALTAGNKPLARPLTPQQKSFIRNYVKTGNATLAARKAGYSDPSHYGSRLLKRMEKSGITVSFLAKKIKEGLNATYSSQLYESGKLKQPESPDYQSRHKFLDTALKMAGAYAPIRHEVTEKRINIVINIDAAKGLLDSGAITDAEYQDIIDVEPLPNEPEETDEMLGKETGDEDGENRDAGGEAAAGVEGTAGTDEGGEQGNGGGVQERGGDSGAVAPTGPPEVAGPES